jgi:hypothetical protein
MNYCQECRFYKEPQRCTHELIKYVATAIYTADSRNPLDCKGADMDAGAMRMFRCGPDGHLWEPKND